MPVYEGEACRSLVHGHALRNHRHAERSGVLSHHGGLVSFLIVHHEVVVQCHLCIDGLFGEEGVEACIGLGRDERGDVGQRIVQPVDDQVIVYLIEDIGYVMGSRILLLDGFNEFIAIGCQCLRSDGLVRGRSELDEDLVLHAEVAECQSALGGGIGLRKELGYVFFVLHFGAKVYKNHGTEYEQSVHQCFLLFKEAVDCDEKFFHLIDAF